MASKGRRDISEAFDIVTVGAGHNGLVAAAYLATAGKRVVVLERNSWFGGGVITRELTVPGFRHDQHSTAHIFILGNPLIKNDDLGLMSRYGLKYVYPDVPFICVFEDGATIGLHRDRNKTCEDIAQFSKRDADAFLKFAAVGETFLPLVAATFYAPPLPMGASLAMLDQSPIGRQLFGLMHKSAYDVVVESFENERVRLFLCRLISENLTGPEEKGTALGLYVFLAFMEAYGVGVPIGGSGALSQALIRCIEDHGGSVLAGRSVEKVVTRNGRAVGVRTSDGAEYTAKDAVIGAIHPHVLGDMVPDVDPAIADAAKRTEISANVCFTVHAALNEPLRFKAGGHVNKAYFTELMPNRLDDLRGFFDSLRYGKIPSRSLIGLISASTFDPSRCPPGKATLHIWDYVPYAHPDGGPVAWDRLKDAFGETILSRVRPFVENLGPENIVAAHYDSPLDMERTSASFRGGDLHGVANHMYQSGAHRPTPELGRNTVPGVERLYLVGPFQHPGGGVFGAGRATAMQVCDDLKIDFDKIGNA
ncbi:MAG TPA: NAD(P)/FAD-dependent oxidoreductase [Xanthobacteraceae bacterium]